MKLTARLFFIPMLFVACSAYAQSTVSMDSILTVVKANNPVLKSYHHRAEAMKAYASGAGSLMAPEVGGGLWMVPYKRVADERDKGQVMISVQQKFTNPSKLHASREFQESKAAIEEADGLFALNELNAAAKSAYVEWIVYEKKKIVLSETELIIKSMMDIANTRYVYNQSKLSQVYKAEARFEEIQNMKLMNDNLIVQKNIQLNKLMNISDNIRFNIDTTFEVNNLLSDKIDTAIFATQRSDIRKIDKSIQALRLNQALENSQAKPDLNLSFNHMIARGTGVPNQFMLLGMLSLPIAPWSSKGYKSNVAGLSKEIDAMRSERATILNESLGRTSGMQADITTIRKQLDNYEKRIIPALRKSYNTVMIAYQENNESLPNVLDACEALSITRLQYLDTVQKLYTTIIEYEKEFEN